MKLKEILAEKLSIEIYGREIPVYKNPGPSTLLNLLAKSEEKMLRGLFAAPDVYWIDGSLAIHHALANELGI